MIQVAVDHSWSRSASYHHCSLVSFVLPQLSQSTLPGVLNLIHIVANLPHKLYSPFKAENAGVPQLSSYVTLSQTIAP